MLFLCISPLFSAPPLTPGKVGVNLVHGYAFVNVVNETNRYSDVASYDSNGWPQDDFSLLVMDNRPGREWDGEIDDPEEYRVDYSGVYQCSFRGQAAVTGMGDVTVTSAPSYNSGTNTTYFEITVGPPGPNHAFVSLTFSNTKRTASSATNTGITELRIMRPGYDINTTQTFTDEYINLCRSADFCCYRYYTVQNIWGGELTYPAERDWADRKLPTHASQNVMTDMNGNMEMWCWEYIVELANILERDIWINLHLCQSDNYVTNLAQFLKDNLDPDINIYIESSNELWGNYDSHGAYNQAEADDLGIGFDYNHGRRTCELSTLFAGVWGASAINNRIRVVLGCQAGNEWKQKMILPWISTNIGSPKNFIYATSIGHYFTSTNPSGTPAQINAGMYEQIDSQLDAGDQGSRPGQLAITNTYQLPGGMNSYEGGNHLPAGGNTSNLDNQILACRTPEMKDVLIYNLTTGWNDLGCDIALHFTIWGGYQRYGVWGLTDDPTKPFRDHRMEAMLELAGRWTGTNNWNDLPFAEPGSAVTAFNTPVSITLTGTDYENDPLTFRIESGPSNGALTGTGAARTYTPNAGWTGTDTITFYAHDGSFESQRPAVFTITVNPPANQSPSADTQSVTTDEDTAKTITLTGSDPEDDPLSFHIDTGPPHGNITGTPPNVTYTPSADYNGSDNFTFYVNDGTSDSASVEISITVNPVNDPPTADSKSADTNEDISLGITLTGSDTENDSLTFHIDSFPSHGNLTGTPPALVYTPDDDWNGDDSFTFHVNDGEYDSAAETVSITVDPQNDPPSASDSDATGLINTPLDITLSASDIDLDSLSFVCSSPSHGILTGTGPDITYLPDPDYTGDDSFTFHVNDGTTDSNTATVTITVNLALPKSDTKNGGGCSSAPAGTESGIKFFLGILSVLFFTAKRITRRTKKGTLVN